MCAGIPSEGEMNPIFEFITNMDWVPWLLLIFGLLAIVIELQILAVKKQVDRALEDKPKDML
jgi:hypothetical protein